jgi:hypothetical protein
LDCPTDLIQTFQVLSMLGWRLRNSK